MLKGLWIKISGLLLTLLGYYFVKNKFQAHKIENLEEENAAHEELDTIQKAVKKAEIKAEAKEDAEIKDFDDSDWRDNI